MAQSHDGFKRETTSSVSTRTDKEKGIVVTTTNRRYTFTSVYPENVASDDQFRTLLLLEEFQSERILRGEGQQGSVTVQAWIGKDASPSEKLWAINHEGDEAAVADRFYRITKHGCCGAEDTYVFFNIMTGSKVFTSTSELFRIEVPNTSNALTRYVSFRSDMASLQAPESEKLQSFVGTLEYGSESKVIGRVIIRLRGEREDMGTPKIRALYRQKLTDSSPLELWGRDKKNDRSSLSAFSLVVSYDKNTRIVIPVSNDALELTRATAPPKFVLSAEPAAAR